MSRNVIGRAEMRSSATARWCACPGSVVLSEGRISETSEFAAEGTAAHQLLELCGRCGMDAADFLGDEITVEDGAFTFTVTQEMADAVQVFLDWVESLGFDAKFVSFERKLDGDSLRIPNWTGHVDYCIECEGHLYVVDFKYGAGVTVEAENNRQLLSYATLVWAASEVEIESATLVIIQPRGMGEPVKVWEITGDEIESHRRRVAGIASTVAYLSDNPEAVTEGEYLKTGDHCKWCPALAVCPKIRDQAQAVAATDFDAIEIGEFSEEQLAFWLGNEKLFRAWLEAVKEEAKLRAENGDSIPGYKLVQTLASRKWIGEPEETEAQLRELGYRKAHLYESKILSPAKVEKLKLPRKTSGDALAEALDDLTHRPPTGIALVKESDKRPAIASAQPEEDFETIE